MKTTLGFLIAFVFLFGCAMQAQPTFFYLDEISLSPVNPAPGEEVCITVNGIKSTPCVYEETFEIYPTGGNNLLLDMCFNDTSTCIQILWPWDTTYCIPGLPAGTYTLQVGGCNHTGIGQSLTFTVSGIAAPQAGFSADPSQGCAPAEIVFTNTSINADSFLWTFGDGSTSTLENPVHTFTAAGAYNVQLEATNSSSGQSDIVSFLIVIYPIPQIDLGPDTTITTAQNLLLNAGAGFLSYLWQDGSTNAFFQISGSQYAPGTYTFSVVVTNAQDCKGGDEIQVTITGPSSTKETYQEAFRVYPNPASDVVHLDTEVAILFVQWLDLTGRVISEEYPSSANLRVPDAPNGTYFLQVFTKNFTLGKLVDIKR